MHYCIISQLTTWKMCSCAKKGFCGPLKRISCFLLPAGEHRRGREAQIKCGTAEVRRGQLESLEVSVTAKMEPDGEGSPSQRSHGKKTRKNKCTEQVMMTDGAAAVIVTGFGLLLNSVS